jgi:hypothetical protein
LLDLEVTPGNIKTIIAAKYKNVKNSHHEAAPLCKEAMPS